MRLYKLEMAYSTAGLKAKFFLWSKIDDLKRGSAFCFQKFWNQNYPTKKMRYVTALHWWESSSFYHPKIWLECWLIKKKRCWMDYINFKLQMIDSKKSSLCMATWIQNPKTDAFLTTTYVQRLGTITIVQIGHWAGVWSHLKKKWTFSRQTDTTNLPISRNRHPKQ